MHSCAYTLVRVLCSTRGDVRIYSNDYSTVVLCAVAGTMKKKKKKIRC